MTKKIMEKKIEILEQEIEVLKMEVKKMKSEKRIEDFFKYEYNLIVDED